MAKQIRRQAPAPTPPAWHHRAAPGFEPLVQDGPILTVRVSAIPQRVGVADPSLLPFVDLRMLIDTGATTSAVFGRAIERLDLGDSEMREVYTGDGIRTAEEYCARFGFLMQTPEGLARAYLYGYLTVTPTSNRDPRFDGVIGRELLKGTSLHYDGIAGTWSLTIPVPKRVVQR